MKPIAWRKSMLLAWTLSNSRTCLYSFRTVRHTYGVSQFAGQYGELWLGPFRLRNSFGILVMRTQPLLYSMVVHSTIQTSFCRGTPWPCNLPVVGAVVACLDKPKGETCESGLINYAWVWSLNRFSSAMHFCILRVPSEVPMGFSMQSLNCQQPKLPTAILNGFSDIHVFQGRPNSQGLRLVPIASPVTTACWSVVGEPPGRVLGITGNPLLPSSCESVIDDKCR